MPSDVSLGSDRDLFPLGTLLSALLFGALNIYPRQGGVLLSPTVILISPLVQQKCSVKSNRKSLPQMCSLYSCSIASSSCHTECIPGRASNMVKMSGYQVLLTEGTTVLGLTCDNLLSYMLLCKYMGNIYHVVLRTKQTPIRKNNEEIVLETRFSCP